MKNILHRDLKSSNILLGEDWEVKLCDFGLSADKKEGKTGVRVGTFQWMAPEVMGQEEKISESADVYSFGVILWEMLCQKIPFDGLSEQQIIGLVLHDQENHLEPPTAGNEILIDIMEKCLQKTPKDRPSFMEIQS